MPGDAANEPGFGSQDEAALLSPCIGVCELDAEAGWCRGCHRTLAEIARWQVMPTAERRRVLADLERRRGQGSISEL